MPSRRQLDQRAEAAEHKAQRREEQAAAIDERAYYWHYDGGEDGSGEGYRRAHLVRTTKQFVFLKRHGHEWEHTYRCRKSDFATEGFAWVGRGTGVFRLYRGDAVKLGLLAAAAEHRREAEGLRGQAASTPEMEPPDPSSQAGLWLTMYYIARERGVPVDRPIDDVLRHSLNEAFRHAGTGEDYDEMIDIAQTHRDTRMVQMLQGEIEVEEVFAVPVAKADWIRTGF